MIKNEEIANLNVEIESLTDFMNTVEQKQQDKIALFKAEIEENAKVIRRSDKLLVDLQQKNEVTQNAVQVSQQKAAQKNREKDLKQMQMKELTDQRDFFCNQIIEVRQKTSTYNEYVDLKENIKIIERQRKDQERAEKNKSPERGLKAAKKKTKTIGLNKDLSVGSSRRSSPSKSK